MRNHTILGLCTIAAIVLCFQNCGANNAQNAIPIDPRLIVTPLADSNISINQGDDLFAAPSVTNPSNTSPLTAEIPANALTQVTVSSSPADCPEGYLPTEYFSARLGFTYFGTGGMFCQLRGAPADQEQIISDFKAVEGTVCPTSFTKIGMLDIDQGRAGISNVSLCVQHERFNVDSRFITLIYMGIVDASTPALRCKTGDTDAGSIGSTYAVCLRR